MANAIGLGSGWSIKKESVWGTGVTPTIAFPFISESLKLDIKRVEAKTNKGGNYLDTSDAWRVGGSVGGGDVQTLLYSSGSSALWEAMLGTYATAGSGPYTHTASIGATLPSYSMEISYGGITSSTARKKVVGAMVDSWEAKFALGAPVTLGTTWVYKSEVLAASTALDGSYPSSMLPFSYTQCVITGGATPAGCVEALSFKGNNNLLKDQFCLGSSTITQPARNGKAEITGGMSVLLTANSVADYALYTAGSELSLIVTCTDGAKTLVITTNVRLDGSTPVVGGDGVVKVDIPFKVIAATTDASGFTAVHTNSDSSSADL